MSIAAPASTAAVSWTVDSAGDVTGATVDWTPANAGDYTLKAQVNASTGTFSCTVCGTGGRSDAITLSAPVASDLVTTSNVAIIED